MISFEDNVIVRGVAVENIEKWVVVFLTPKGIVDDLATAVQIVKSMDLPPDVIKPMVVARGATLEEICL